LTDTVPARVCRIPHLRVSLAGWLPGMTSAADRLDESGELESKRLSGIEKVWAKIVSWFYSGKEPEGKPEREPSTTPLYLVPGTVQNRLWLAQQGYVEVPPPPSREGYRDEEQLFYRKAEEREHGK
jgi:hypothetical protein